MAEFDIGWVPAGWERGEKLAVVQAIRHQNGDVRPGYVSQWDMPPFSGAAEDHVAEVRFMPDDGPRVTAWLEWWHGDA
ncbi:MAG: hypothetical protein HY856_13550 [Burkholderiales bacterium]|nr:hypothetical protein [Burkholderiales bacterium]